MLLALALLQQRPSVGLTAFNCSVESGATTEAFDLLVGPPDSCQPDGAPAAAGPPNTAARILGRKERSTETGFRCHARVTRRTTRCGLDGLSYGSKLVEADREVPVTPEECRRMRDAKTWRFEGQEVHLPNENPVTVSYFSHGQIHPEGGCRGSWSLFWRNHQSFWKSAEETELTVTAAPYVRSASLPPAEGSGTYVVDETLSCLGDLETLYSGPALRESAPRDSVVVSPGPDWSVRLHLLERRLLCGAEAWATQLEGVLVQLPDQQPAVSQRNSAPSLGEASLRQRLSALGRSRDALALRLCRAEWQERAAAYSLAAGGASPAVVRNVFGPGVRVRTAGRLAYVTRCAPLSVTLRQLPGCTRDIPVEVPESGRRAYADPFTLILSDTSAEVPCGPEAPVAWEVDGQWHCATGRSSAPCSPPPKTPPVGRE